MAISRELSEQIRDLLKDHPEGLSITDIVKVIPVNRNTASRYLDTLLVSGQVEMRHLGMAKIYTLSHRLPVASVLSISSEYILQVDQKLRIIFLNTPFLELLELSESDVIGKKMDYTRIPVIFGDEYVRLLRWITEALSGLERRGEIFLDEKKRILACRATPAVFSEGHKGVTVIFEDITTQRYDEEQLKVSEEKFRTLVQASTDGILLSNREAELIEWNDAMTRITGISREEVIGKPIIEIMRRCLITEHQNGDYINSVERLMETALRTGSSRSFFVPFEAEIRRSDGERRIIQQTHFPIKTSQGILIGSVIHDITERQQMLSEITAREERFRALFNNSADMITLHEIGADGMPGRFMEVNDVACRRLGYSREELLQMSPRDIIDPACLPVMQENAGKLIAGGNVIFEITHRARDGRKIPVEVRSRLFEYQGSTFVLGQVRDLTRKKEVETALRKSEARLRSIIRAAPVGIGLVIHREIQEVNDQLLLMLGYSKEELIGKSARILYPTREDFEWVGMEKHEQLVRTGAGCVESRWITKDGIILDILLSSTPLDPQNLSAGIIFTALDITERKQSEQAIRSSERRYRRLLEQMFDAVVIHAGGIIRFANESAARLIGVSSPDDMVGRSIRDFVHPSSWQSVQERMADLETKLDMTLPLVRQKYLRVDGTTIDVEIMSTVFLDHGVPATQTVFRNISERVATETALERSEEQYRTLAESAADMIYITDINGTIVYANPLCAMAYGCTPSELVGRRQTDLFPPEIARGHIARIRQLFETGEPVEHIETIPIPSGTMQIDIKLSPIRSSNGSIISVVGIARDITGRIKPADPAGPPKKRDQ